MPVQAHGLAMAVTEVKHRHGALEVQKRVAAMYRAVVVGAEEDEVAKSVVTATAEPVPMVRFAEIGTVSGARRPFTDLATARVEPA